MWDIITLIVLILLSGFFSGIEIAFMSLSFIRVNFLVKNKVKHAKTLERLKKDPFMVRMILILNFNVAHLKELRILG